MPKDSPRRRNPRGGRAYPRAFKDFWCRKFVEAQEAFDISAAEFAEKIDVGAGRFCGWLKERGITWDQPSDGYRQTQSGHRQVYWRHGGLTTPQRG